MKETIKAFLYMHLPIPHWWMWRVEAGYLIFVDGCGGGKCLYRFNEWVACEFDWASVSMIFHQSDVLYMCPEGDEPQL